MFYPQNDILIQNGEGKTSHHTVGLFPENSAIKENKNIQFRDFLPANNLTLFYTSLLYSNIFY